MGRIALKANYTKFFYSWQLKYTKDFKFVKRNLLQTQKLEATDKRPIMIRSHVW